MGPSKLCCYGICSGSLVTIKSSFHEFISCKSSWERLKSKTLKFSSILAGFLDFGIETMLFCIAHLINTCAGVFEYLSANLSSFGSFNLFPGFQKKITVYLFPYKYDTVVGSKSIRQRIYDLKP